MCIVYLVLTRGFWNIRWLLGRQSSTHLTVILMNSRRECKAKIFSWRHNFVNKKKRILHISVKDWIQYTSSKYNFMIRASCKHKLLLYLWGHFFKSHQRISTSKHWKCAWWDPSVVDYDDKNNSYLWVKWRCLYHKKMCVISRSKRLSI